MRRTGVALLLLGLAACGSSRSNDAAGVVDGTSVSRTEYEDLVRAVVASSDLFGIEEDPATGTIAADAGRRLLSLLVSDVARTEYLADRGATVSEADRQAALEALAAPPEVPENVLELLVRGAAGATAIGRLASESGDAQAAYEASPAEVGVMCVRHILVETEEDARDVLAELEGGADFAELATERSTEPAAATTGGAIELQPGQPCIPLAEAQGSLDPTFVAGAVEAVPGTPTEPVQTSFGWHVILARPYDEVAVAVDPLVGEQRFDEHLAEVDVDVDPRYGRWDRGAGAVVALAEPAFTSSVPAP